MSRDYYKHLLDTFITSSKWIGLGILTGITVGAISSLFSACISMATNFREAYPNIIFLLPFAGLLIVFMYRTMGIKEPKGTNLVITSVREKKHVTWKMAPLIIVSTVLTHLFGGSAGREGAALQVGGSLGSQIGRLLHIKEKDRRTILMCGMSASFSALFGTPLAASIFALELSTVGILYYNALVPSVISALSAHLVARALNVHGEAFSMSNIPTFSIKTSLVTFLFAVLCAMVSVLFCTVMHKTKHILKKKIKNSYMRIFVSGIIIILLTLLVGDQTYNGTGAHILEACFSDGYRVVWYAFLAKMVFTAITLGGGFQGGEIVPSLFIGATFGNAISQITGIEPTFMSALGMCAVFCGVTNCPIASLLISFELFGFEPSKFFIIAVATSYLFSGNYGLYASQKILHSKVESDEVNVFTH